jgi:hypothetical protein
MERTLEEFLSVEDPREIGGVGLMSYPNKLGSVTSIQHGPAKSPLRDIVTVGNLAKSVSPSKVCWMLSIAKLV